MTLAEGNQNAIRSYTIAEILRGHDLLCSMNFLFLKISSLNWS